MTTIYAIHGPNGFIGRCDAKCHNAKGDDCKCICGGANHGIGTKAAIEDRNNCSNDELITEAKILLGPGQYRIVRHPLQMELFK